MEVNQVKKRTEFLKGKGEMNEIIGCKEEYEAVTHCPTSIPHLTLPESPNSPLLLKTLTLEEVLTIISSLSFLSI